MKLFLSKLFNNLHRKSSKVQVICFQRQSTSSKMKKKKKKSDENISVVLKSFFSHFFRDSQNYCIQVGLGRAFR